MFDNLLINNEEGVPNCLTRLWMWMENRNSAIPCPLQSCCTHSLAGLRRFGRHNIISTDDQTRIRARALYFVLLQRRRNVHIIQFAITRGSGYNNSNTYVIISAVPTTMVEIALCAHLCMYHGRTKYHMGTYYTLMYRCQQQQQYTSVLQYFAPVRVYIGSETGVVRARVAVQTSSVQQRTYIPL